MNSSFEDIAHIAVVGAGTIGASWAALFLSRGYKVSLVDPSAHSTSAALALMERAWRTLETEELFSDAVATRLNVCDLSALAGAGVDFVQESGPESLGLKRVLYAEMEAVFDPQTIFASSTSGLTMSEIQAECAYPQRCVVGHPFNPPHLMPLVELVAGRKTSEAALERAELFYKGLGKKTIRLKKEVPGHIPNRLQFALWREAAHLALEGVADIEDIDRAVVEGPGLRWALLGPTLTFHLGGGNGGLDHFLDHLAAPIQSWWDDLGAPTLSRETVAKLVEKASNAYGDVNVAALSAARDQALTGLLNIKAPGLST